jgi:hypothetical protein
MRRLLWTIGFALAAATPVAMHATTGCNAVGRDEPHGLIGCDLYYPAVSWGYEEGIVSGYPDAGGKFLPEKTINRAEFTKIVVKTFFPNELECGGPSRFADAPDHSWFSFYICVAASKKLIGGYPDGTFKPAQQINFAEAAKILANAAQLSADPDDANWYDETTVWYRPYTQALLTKRAVAPTIDSFGKFITRGEMIEMIYRLKTGKNDIDNPTRTEDGDSLGLGYNYSFSLEFLLGLTVDPPDPPFIVAPSTRRVTGAFTNNLPLKGYAFSHVLEQERCSLSGLREHCKPTYTDWSIGLFVVPSSVSFSKDYRDVGVVRRFFGGKPGDCVQLGVEGENTEYCIVPLEMKKTLVVVRDFIDSNVMQVEGATPVETSDAYYARIRKSMRFVSP